MATPRKRRSSRPPPPPVEPRPDISMEAVIERLDEHGRPYEPAFLEEVYDFSAQMHENQTRRSGEPYLTHPLYVAYILSDLRFDGTCVAVGLLHDVLEDTLTTRKVLEEKFGEEIAGLVDGVTKIGRHAYVRRDQVQSENFRKLILSSAKDIRVILVKLADRLHNMMTLQHMPAEARRRIAQETLEIYAPIAHRLGMSKLQGDLEDLSFYFLYPQQFLTLRTGLSERVKVGRVASERILVELKQSLDEGGIEADLSYRVKRYYSVYRKLRRQGIDISRLYDYLAYRVVTQEIKDCYAALGVVHQNWRPVPGRFKDYIAMPKPNLYQSLHTTVLGEGGQPFEVQIRTQEMDLVAEEGIAAHWRYKAGRSADPEADRKLSWLRQLTEWQKEVEDPRTFMTTLKIDLYPDEVYAFSPKGDVFSLPRGATPLDFAYRIHTELGHQCVGARVNGKLVPLRSKLRNGDIVEIVTNPSRHPSRDWLNFVATSRAKSKIRQWLNTEQKRRSMEIGRRLMEREIKKHKLNPKKILAGARVAEYLTSEGIASIDDLFSRVGFGKVAPRQVLDRVLDAEQLATTAEEPGRLRQAMTRILPFQSTAVTVKGSDDLLTYLAQCCNPLPGERIVGFITRGRGVSVHSAECPNVENLLYNPEREIEVEWARGEDGVYPIELIIETEDEQGMLARLTEAIAKQQANIRHIEAEALETGRGLIEVVVAVRDRKHLEKVRQGIRGVNGVLQVARRMGNSPKRNEASG